MENKSELDKWLNLDGKHVELAISFAVARKLVEVLEDNLTAQAKHPGRTPVGQAYLQGMQDNIQHLKFWCFATEKETLTAIIDSQDKIEECQSLCNHNWVVTIYWNRGRVDGCTICGITREVLNEE